MSVHKCDRRAAKPEKQPYTENEKCVSLHKKVCIDFVPVIRHFVCKETHLMCLASKCVWETQHVKCVWKGEVSSKIHCILHQFSIVVGPRGTAMDVGMQRKETVK